MIIVSSYHDQPIGQISVSVDAVDDGLKSPHYLPFTYQKRKEYTQHQLSCDQRSFGKALLPSSPIEYLGLNVHPPRVKLCVMVTCVMVPLQSTFIYFWFFVLHPAHRCTCTRAHTHKGKQKTKNKK